MAARLSQAFRASMTWMPAFARTIRRVEIVDDAPVSIDCTFTPLLDESAIHVVSISGTRRQRALRFDLSTATASCSGLTLPDRAHSPAI